MLNSFGDLAWQPLLDSRGSVTVLLSLRDLLSRDCQGAVRLPQKLLITRSATANCGLRLARDVGRQPVRRIYQAEPRRYFRSVTIFFQACSNSARACSLKGFGMALG